MLTITLTIVAMRTIIISTNVRKIIVPFFFLMFSHKDNIDNWHVLLTTCHTKNKGKYNRYFKGIQYATKTRMSNIWIYSLNKRIWNSLYRVQLQFKTVKSATICLFFFSNSILKKHMLIEVSFIQGFECGFTIFLVKSWLKY